MNCIICKEIIGDGERMCLCWLCDGLAHMKCAGLNVKIIEGLLKIGNGLRWFCKNCNCKKTTDLFQVLKKSKKTFNDITNDLKKIQKKLSDYELLFNDMNFEDKDLSPKRKKTENNVICVPTGSRLSLVAPLQITYSTPIIEEIPNSPTVSQKRSSLGDKTASSQTVGPIASEMDEGVSDGLVVVPPEKFIFISRLHPNTTCEMVVNYVKKKLSVPDLSLKCYKMQFSYERRISSFKLFAPDPTINLMLSPDFWPKFTIAHEFKNNP
ncbi:uncharacterized protein LOC129909191 [Episyrphus balteatus]|uniref:uncharacterized protein LOC129909191 n=1 Tax=Episyrphus balteatus TaxID=286459 RepID=UPI002486B08F|nr:uncharacterized protein LOC129909191 [Episyrphus balteatus]